MTFLPSHTGLQQHEGERGEILRPHVKFSIVQIPIEINRFHLSKYTPKEFVKEDM